MDRRFILGIGAQKAGTTWLYAYLARDPAFVRGFSKEYHIWDVRNVPAMQAARRSLPRVVAKGLVRRDFRTLSKKVRLWQMSSAGLG